MGSRMRGGSMSVGFKLQRRLQRLALGTVLMAVAGCGGGPASPTDVAQDQFLEGNFPKAIEVAETVIDDSSASADDRVAMLVLKGRCYYEMGAAASPAGKQSELFEQGLAELDDCLEFVKNQALEQAGNAAAQDSELAADDLPGLLRDNLSGRMVTAVSEALHLRSTMQIELGNEEAALASQRMWREVDPSFRAAYESEGPEEVLLTNQQMNVMILKRAIRTQSPSCHVPRVKTMGRKPELFRIPKKTPRISSAPTRLPPPFPAITHLRLR